MQVTKEQIKTLDRMWQEKVLNNSKHISLLGCTADVGHHWISKGAGGFSLRWFIPNGIPLNHTQHDVIHNKGAEELKELIKNIKGKEWENILAKQRMKCVKYIEYKEIVKHINGETSKY